MDEDKILGVRLADGTEVRSQAVVVAVGARRFHKQAQQVMAILGLNVRVIQSLPYSQQKSLLFQKKILFKHVNQGLALRDVAVSVLAIKGKTLVTHQMDMLFTHFGLSGPAYFAL